MRDQDRTPKHLPVPALLHRLLCEDDGQDLVEYALIAGLIGLSTITVIRAFSSKIGVFYSSLSNGLTNSF